jgi:bifunctional DNA-binding transcriptional regulator/antitoxin component of YhaV-PrlF toxin-antitoxin module
MEKTKVKVLRVFHVTIPEDARRRLSIKIGEELEFTVEGSRNNRNRGKAREEPQMRFVDTMIFIKWGQATLAEGLKNEEISICMHDWNGARNILKRALGLVSIVGAASKAAQNFCYGQPESSDERKNPTNLFVRIVKLTFTHKFFRIL